MDPSLDTAECPFCGASFVVQKAINNYQVQHASFGHVDNVNIDMRGTVHEVLDFVGDQMSESRKMRREFRKEEKERKGGGESEAVHRRLLQVRGPFFCDLPHTCLRYDVP